MISKEAIPLIMLKLLHISIIYLAFLKIINYFLLPQGNNSIGELILPGREEPNHSQWPRPPCNSAVLTESISNGSQGHWPTRVILQGITLKSIGLGMRKGIHGGTRFFWNLNLRITESFLSQENSTSTLLTCFPTKNQQVFHNRGEKMKEQLYFKIQQAEIFYKVSAIFKF